MRLILLARDHRLNIKLLQKLVDPIRPVGLVPTHLQRPGLQLSPLIRQVLLRLLQKLLHTLRLMHLPSRDHRRQGVPLIVAHQVNLAGKTALRPA